MKELSIEEKAKLYDDLLIRLQEAKVDNDVCDERYCCVIDVIVPELKESEDERIRKGIIRNLKYLLDKAQGFVKDELAERIAWLEKQGQTSTKKDIDEVFVERACDAYCNLCDTKECVNIGECDWVERFRKYLMR